MWYLSALGAVAGLVLGSLANAVIYRLPRRLPMGHDRSRCPKCDHVLSWVCLIPLVSYGIQRGRCRYCLGVIPFRYFLVEVIMLVLGLWGGVMYPDPIQLGCWIVYSFLLVCLFFIDLDCMVLPLSLTGSLIGLGSVFGLMVNGVWGAMLGGLLGGGVYAVLMGIGWWVYRKPVLGGGDVLLGVGIGAFWGVGHVAFTVYLSFILGGFWGIVLLLKGRGRQAVMPFGPSIILASFAVHGLHFLGIDRGIIAFIQGVFG